jgi:hypothetical protein
MTFREGGAYDYHTVFEQIKERLYNAIQLARDEGRNIGSLGVLGASDLAAVHLEQLPAYEPAGGAANRSNNSEPIAGSMTQRDAPTALEESNSASSKSQLNETYAPPDEPPPGYEEAQAQAVGISLEQRERENAERGIESDDD